MASATDNAVYKITGDTNQISLFAGGGTITTASGSGTPALSVAFSNVATILGDSTNQYLYFVDNVYRNIRRLRLVDNLVFTYSGCRTPVSNPCNVQSSGNGGAVTSVLFIGPW